MSRTKQGAKPAGFEYWTARPGNRCGGCPGAFQKKQTHKAERKQGIKEARESEA